MEGLWQLFADGVPDILVQLSLDGKILHINRTPPGLAPSDVLGRNVFEFLAPVSRPAIRRSLIEVFAGGDSRVHEVPAIAADGGICWFAAHIGPVVVGGRVAAAAVVARDVTIQKRAEFALRESEARYRTLVENAPEAIVVLDVDAGRFMDVNANACLLFAMTREDLLTREPVELSPPLQTDGRPSGDAANEYIREALAGETPAFEWVHRSATGADIRCEVRLVRLPAAGRRLVRGSIIDVTARRQLERQLHQYQKLDTLGQLAGGIAHDFNNILLVIGNTAEILSHDLAAGSTARADAETIRAAAARGAQLTQQILSFARQREPRHEPVNLNAVVQQTVAMLRRLMGPSVTLVQELDASVESIQGDRGQLEQILANLLLNARDAIGSDGTVTVSTRRLLDESIALLVSDNGVGMDDITRARIFEPFFTTKPAGQGTGLGLATVNTLVRQHGASIAVISELGVGTTFEIVFPS